MSLKGAVATFQMIMRFMGDKDDVSPPAIKTGRNDKEGQRLESQYDILAAELYPLIVQQYQLKLEEEEDPYEKVRCRASLTSSEMRACRCRTE
jgi:hypothetical protein